MCGKFQSHILSTSHELTNGNYKQIHVVFDRYELQSIKNGTREKRGDTGQSYSHHIEQDVALPRNWKHFLSYGDNKAGFATCYIQYMSVNIKPKLGIGQLVYLSGGNDDFQSFSGS